MSDASEELMRIEVEAMSVDEELAQVKEDVLKPLKKRQNALIRKAKQTVRERNQARLPLDDEDDK